MTEENEESKPIDQNTNSDRQNTVDKTTDILRPASRTMNVIVFLSAKAFSGFQFSAANFRFIHSLIPRLHGLKRSPLVLAFLKFKNKEV